MTPRYRTSLRLCTLALIALFAATPAAADKNGDSGKHERKSEKQRKEHKKHRDDDRHKSERSHFSDDDRRIIDEYYGAKFRSGNCPPGLAKKKNGCQPPGQAKKWAVGKQLPSDAERYDLPNELLVKLPVPPSGQRYIRVASDILLIAVGTGMVMGAIEDIGKQF